MTHAVKILTQGDESIVNLRLPPPGLIPHEKPKVKSIHHKEYACTWFFIAFLLIIHSLPVFKPSTEVAKEAA